MKVLLFNLVERQNFTNFISDVYNATRACLDCSISFWGYTFTWYDLLRFSLLTLLFGACMIVLFGADFRERKG